MSLDDTFKQLFKLLNGQLTDSPHFFSLREIHSPTVVCPVKKQKTRQVACANLTGLLSYFGIDCNLPNAGAPLMRNAPTSPPEKSNCQANITPTQPCCFAQTYALT
jgi:hypothetical protein